MYNTYPPPPNPSTSYSPLLAANLPPSNPFVGVPQHPTPQSTAANPFSAHQQQQTFQPDSIPTERPLSGHSNPFSATTPIQRTKQDLPVFTSSSPIPFAAPANKDLASDGMKKEEPDNGHRFDGI